MRRSRPRLLPGGIRYIGLTGHRDRKGAGERKPVRNMGGIKVFVTDDHLVVRRGLERILAEEADMELVGEASSATDLLKQLERSGEGEWDVLVLDITLPDRSGLEILPDIKALKPGLPVLFLSIHPEEQYARRALEVGASGYLSKDRAGDEIPRAIRAVAGGGTYYDASLARGDNGKQLPRSEP